MEDLLNKTTLEYVQAMEPWNFQIFFIQDILLNLQVQQARRPYNKNAWLEAS